MSESEDIRKALAEAQRYLGELPSPPNEANTCDWVVRPLLLALGYLNHEIHAQAGDVSNKFPDYTVLPQTNHTWYLEAKAWSVGLESSHVDQAMNYAHSNGQRWVVLSNGREWRLYDDRIAGKSADRLVATARLEDTDGMLRFLGAIRRESMLSQKVADYASERRVREYLSSALSEPKSPVIQAVLRVVRQNLGNGPITAEAVVDILNARHSGSVAEPGGRSGVTHVATPTVKPARKDGIVGPLFIDWKGLYAEGWYAHKRFVVKKGARIAKKPSPSYAPIYEKKIPTLIDSGRLAVRDDHLELLDDAEFKTPSGASDFVFGASTNGWTNWADKSGTVLDRLYPRSKEEAPWLYNEDGTRKS